MDLIRGDVTNYHSVIDAMPLLQMYMMLQVWYTVLLQGPMAPVYISSLSPSLFLCTVEYTYTVLPYFHIVTALLQIWEEPCVWV
jgi:hypothetical protein